MKIPNTPVWHYHHSSFLLEFPAESIDSRLAFIDKNKLPTLIEIDGGVDGENARRCVDAGADILVIGNAFFNSPDRLALTQKIQTLKR